MVTVCVKCKWVHYDPKYECTVNESACYTCLAQANQFTITERINPVKGTKTYHRVWDNGRIGYSLADPKDTAPLCEEVNKGNCPHYEEYEEKE